MIIGAPRQNQRLYKTQVAVERGPKLGRKQSRQGFRRLRWHRGPISVFNEAVKASNRVAAIVSEKKTM